MQLTPLPPDEMGMGHEWYGNGLGMGQVQDRNGLGMGWDDKGGFHADGVLPRWQLCHKPFSFLVNYCFSSSLVLNTNYCTWHISVKNRTYLLLSWSCKEQGAYIREIRYLNECINHLQPSFHVCKLLLVRQSHLWHQILLSFYLTLTIFLVYYCRYI